MELQEIFEGGKPTIIVDKTSPGGDTMLITAPWIVADKRNKNNRIYSRELITREIARVEKSIKAGSFIGSGDHNLTGYATIKDASHIVQKLELGADGIGLATLKILPTQRGRTIQTLIKNNAQLGLSPRGFGNISKSGEVMSDYKLLGLDIVVNQSEPLATFSKENVFESVEFEEENEENDKQRKKDLAEASDNLLSDSFTAAVNDGMWYGSFEEWKAKFSKPIKEVLGLENDEKIKLSEEQKSAKLISAYNESVTAGYKGDFNEWKKKFPNIIEFCLRPTEPTEAKVKPKTPVQYKTSWDEVQASGFKGTMEDFRKQFPQITLSLPKPPLTEDEKFEEESKKIFEALKKNNPDSTITLEIVKETLKKEKGEDPDSALRRKAISNVNLSISGSGSAPSKEMLEKWIQEEIEYLKKQKKLNWQAYENLLVGDK